MMPIVMVHSANCARYLESHSNEQVEHGQQSRSPPGRKLLKKMKAYAKSDAHIKASQASLAYQMSLCAGSVIQQLQNVAEQERMMNRKAVKSFFHCAHFLACQHIPHTTNFEKLVELVVSCGGEDLKNFLDRTGRNTMYISHVAIIEALGTWDDESLLKCLRQASCFSIMARDGSRIQEGVLIQ